MAGYATKSKNQNSLRRDRCFWNNFYIFGYLESIHFFYLTPPPPPPSLLSPTQSLKLLLLPYHLLCNTSLTFGMPFCTSGHQILLNLLPSEAEDISQVLKISLLVHLAFLQPVYSIFLNWHFNMSKL